MPRATVTAEPTIEKKGYTDQRAKTVLLEALRGRNGQLTRADAMAASGLPQDETQRGLTLLLKEYRSHLSATESGELLYQFDPAFARRDAVPFRERAAAIGNALWKGFSFLFKVTIMGTLVVYFTAFVAMLIALVFARSNDRDDDDRGGFGGLFWIWGWGIGGNPDPYGRAPARPRQPPFYKSVFAFVFGPPLPPVDPLRDEKELLSFIRGNDGRIAAADLVRLMGWDFARAEEEVTRLMVDYDGEPAVTDDGVVLYVFKDLRKTGGADIGDRLLRPRLAWERLEAEPVLTGNSPDRNTVIGLFNAFNLSAPLWVVPMFEAKFRISLASWDFLLRDFPLAFSSVFFGVPFVRWLKARLGRRRRAAANQRRSLLQRIFASLAPRRREDLAPTKELGAALDKELVALGGDVEPDEDGRLNYQFPRIKQELEAVAQARAAAPRLERDPGAVIFSSND
ncbi:MAG TPA: hypothetical protein VGL59_17185 [Polyangia bacterium]|jgi:hypothetical protein